MTTGALSTYGSWNLTQPIGPLRSYLYSLQPIGVGTSKVESLTGYVARLANAHCVSPGDLIAHECKSLVRQPQGKSYLHQVSASTEILNGTGQMAGEFVQVFNSLTLRQDLKYLTFLQWADVLPSKGLLRRFHAWCPACYEEWQENGQKIYIPLLWTLSTISLCPNHHQLLLLQCPHCQRQLPSLAWHSRPGYCSKCLQWLGSASKADNFSMAPAELEWQIWIAKNIEELLAYTPSLVEPPTRVNVARSLSICVAQATEGSITEFARKAGLLKSAVSQWRSGKALPQLSILLKVCRALDVSLIDFLLNSASLNDIKPLTTTSFNSQSESQRLKHQLETFHLQESLQAAISEEPPLAMKAVAQRLGYSVRSIRRRFPTLCSAISMRYLNHRDKIRVAKVEQCCQEVRQVAIMLYNQGIEPSRSYVTQHLRKPAYFRDPIVAAALIAVRQELGLE
jgi:transcriptional regulator with XRE-family HTH domain